MAWRVCGLSQSERRQGALLQQARRAELRSAHFEARAQSLHQALLLPGEGRVPRVKQRQGQGHAQATGAGAGRTRTGTAACDVDVESGLDSEQQPASGASSECAGSESGPNTGRASRLPRGPRWLQLGRSGTVARATRASTRESMPGNCSLKAGSGATRSGCRPRPPLAEVQGSTPGATDGVNKDDAAHH